MFYIPLTGIYTRSMYHLLLFIHSLMRWLVLASLVAAIFRAGKGLRSGAPFTATDNSFRHWTATIAHIQLMAGCMLYFTSPLIKLFFSGIKAGEMWFFGLVHLSLMVAAIVVITIGSALAKRRVAAKDKFRTMLTWFSTALLIIFIAIPWPFSPFAGRPLLRSF